MVHLFTCNYFSVKCQTSFLSLYSLLFPVNHVTLSFTDFDIENRQNCTTDFVEILDGNNYEAPLQGIVPFPFLFHMQNYTQRTQEKFFCECSPASWIFSDKGSSLATLDRGDQRWRISL